LAFTYQGEALMKRVVPLAESVGSKIIAPCDVSNEHSIDALFATIKEKWGGLDFLVHCIAFSDKNETRRPLCRYHAREFPAYDGYLLLFLHGAGAARGAADAERAGVC